ncbi:hypothetical protein OG889_22510 [Streptomyces sp. NBC_00481]|nr:hypothetical protein [Streptomyces sp. NBC_00481]WRY97254.1 hypothetical protein OG889_22510 [Streptomyces sp. NBC_00481]
MAVPADADCPLPSGRCRVADCWHGPSEQDRLADRLVRLKLARE